jgi:hypothetical protein
MPAGMRDPGSGMRLRGAITPLFVFFLLLGACTQQSVPANLPPGLIVLPGAGNVHVTKQTAITYDLAEPYPAEAVTRELTNRLAAQGWRPLDADVLNPSVRTQVREWGSFDDLTRANGPKHVHQWSGDWEKTDGTVVRYLLRYESKSPAAGAPTPETPLSVSGALMSPEAIKRIRSAVGQ